MTYKYQLGDLVCPKPHLRQTVKKQKQNHKCVIIQFKRNYT